MRNIGFQFVGPAWDAKIRQWLAIGCPSTIGFVDPDLGTVDNVADVTDGKPVTFWGRLVRPFAIEQMTTRAAIEYADDVIRKADSLDRLIKIWQAANEVASGAAWRDGKPMPVSRNAGEIAQVATFDIAFSAQLKKHGLQAMGTAWATGTPYTGDDGLSTRNWSHYWPALNDDLWLNAHEYWHHGADSEPWHVGRLARVWDQWPTALKDDPVMVSELGWEVVPGVEGWWQSDRPTISISQYLGDLSRYSKMMPPTWAASLFAVARPGEQWSTYDIKPLLPYLAEMWRDAPAHVWPAEGSKNLDVKVLDKMLRDRLTAVGIEYDNLIGHFKDQTGAGLDRQRDYSKLHGLAIHHSAGSPTGSTTAIYDVLIDRGLGGFSYHFVIYCARRNGVIWRKVRIVRDPKDFGAHVKNNNDRWIGAVWPGAYHINVPDAEVMKAQAEQVAIIVKALRDWTGKQDLSIKGHRDITPPGYTECPDNGRWFETGFRPLFDRAITGEPPQPPTEDDYQRGLKDGKREATTRAIGIIENALEALAVEEARPIMEEALYGNDKAVYAVADAERATKGKVLFNSEKRERDLT